MPLNILKMLIFKEKYRQIQIFIYLGEGENGMLQLATLSVYQVHTYLKAETPNSGAGVQLCSDFFSHYACLEMLLCLLPYPASHTS